MKKSLAKLLSVMLVLVMAIGCISAFSVAAVENNFTAKLGFANSDWSAQEWGDNANTTVTGSGTYSVSWDGAASDALVFVVDIAGAQAALNDEGKTFKLTGLTVTVDGTEVPVDMSKVVTGDIEENGNWRIEIYNEYGSTKGNPPIDPAAVSFASNLTVTFTIETVSNSDDAVGEFVCKLGFANSDWSAQEWGDNANTTVTGGGTYSVSWDGAASDALVFVVDIAGAQAALNDLGKTFELTGLTVTVDGTEVPVDLSKVVTGDIEENGNWRIEIYNEYGSTKGNPPIDPAAVSFASNLTVTFTLAVSDTVPSEPTDPPATEPPKEVDLNGTYNAYLLLQTPNWTYRDAWNSTNGIGSDYWGNFIFGNETKEKYGVVVDAVIAGNGTYTVSVTDFGSIFGDDFTATGQDFFNILGVTTDIPVNDTIKITDVKLIIDGTTRHTYKDAYLNPDDTEYMTVLVQNRWNDDVKEISYYPVPTTSLVIQFTVSGFAYDNASQVVEPTEPAPTEPVTEPASNNSTGIIIAVVAVVAVAAVVVVVVVLKKKKAN